MSRIDVLLVIEPDEAPRRLAARARRIVRVPARSTSPALIGELRGIIPGLVGVVGNSPLSVEIARDVHDAGFPTVLFTDGPVLAPAGVAVQPVTDPGPPMEVVDSAPRPRSATRRSSGSTGSGATSPAISSRSSSSSTPAAASRTVRPSP